MSFNECIYRYLSRDNAHLPSRASGIVFLVLSVVPLSRLCLFVRTDLLRSRLNPPERGDQGIETGIISTSSVPRARRGRRVFIVRGWKGERAGV